TNLPILQNDQVCNGGTIELDASSLTGLAVVSDTGDSVDYTAPPTLPRLRVVVGNDPNPPAGEAFQYRIVCPDGFATRWTNVLLVAAQPETAPFAAAPTCGWDVTISTTTYFGAVLSRCNNQMAIRGLGSMSGQEPKLNIDGRGSAVGAIAGFSLGDTFDKTV